MIYIPPLQRSQRLEDIVKPVIEHYHKNPVVNLISQQYASGAILTKEEALYRMILVLAENNEQISDELTKRIFESAPQIVIPKIV